MADVDTTFISIIVVIFVILGFGAYLFGMWSNVIWRCKQLRSFLKKNYIIINLLDKDKKGIVQAVVNAVKGKIIYRDFTWYITEGSIWRLIEISAEKEVPDAKPGAKDSSRLLSKEPKHHNFMDNIVHVEGVPMVFLDMDTLMPVGFENSTAKVKANEISAFLQADWMNEYAKMQAQNKQMSLLLILAVILSLATIVVCYVMIGGVDQKVSAVQGQTAILSKISDNINLIMAKEGLIPQGSVLSNGSIIIPVGK